MSSRGVNKVILVGNLGQDPELRFTADGTAVATLSLATSESWKDKNTGERKEATEWHRVVIFDRLAEIAGEYLKKGSKAYIEGRLQTRKWQDNDGNNRYTTEIRAHELQMLDSKPQGSSGSASDYAKASGGTARPSAPPPMDDFDDDIPF